MTGDDSSGEARGSGVDDTGTAGAGAAALLGLLSLGCLPAALLAPWKSPNRYI